MANKISLEDASSIIAQITTLDAKLISLIKSLDSMQTQLVLNEGEIKKRLNLEETNKGLEVKIKLLKNETDELKNEIQLKANSLTNSGWVVPVPERNIGVKASVSM